MMVRELAVVLACAAASVFAVAGVVGMFRFPDPYTRLHASSLSGTTAVFSAFIAALIAAPNFAVAARILVIILFFLASNPTTTHIIARYAWKSGLDPWKRIADRKRHRGGGPRQ